jgi:hypothetical protein
MSDRQLNKVSYTIVTLISICWGYGLYKFIMYLL